MERSLPIRGGSDVVFKEEQVSSIAEHLIKRREELMERMEAKKREKRTRSEQALLKD